MPWLRMSDHSQTFIRIMGYAVTIHINLDVSMMIVGERGVVGWGGELEKIYKKHKKHCTLSRAIYPNVKEIIHMAFCLISGKLFR